MHKKPENMHIIYHFSLKILCLINFFIFKPWFQQIVSWFGLQEVFFVKHLWDAWKTVNKSLRNSIWKCSWYSGNRLLRKSCRWICIDSEHSVTALSVYMYMIYFLYCILTWHFFVKTEKERWSIAKYIIPYKLTGMEWY